ncbi:Crp/Fnr family transcriptional regulator [Chryseobacterium sp. Chry.R1]|uniref:Crp/Fnr family transcriptional regulator n=1 Tax=unclassified Chryseobacterium TaxID=2593645 RepID=UPI002358C363|nr:MULTISPECIES: Crp/Fnr family transcriptional regulator [unclassified Chryseobacterium]MDC8104265.1 Crp/Fnr family transcriptional regulator [Chryseobacterium sp. B21-037]MDQ1803874.1 Crp/Fnr family transcriptional regulator [Chryseobacterium sp. CKR4-1]WBV57795.1 Crp/Fnr family transcriptional regulator [Chryseobacterium daecheongense]
MSPDKNALAKILSNFEQEELPNKTLLTEEGKMARKFYYLKKGVARGWLNNDGKEITFQFLFEGNFISSWESLFYNSPSIYNIETIEPCTVYSTSIEDFRQIIENNPDSKELYYSYLQERLLKYQKLFISRIKDSAEERYNELIKQSPEIFRRVPQYYIASYLGITSVSLSRIRGKKI